MSIQVYQHVDVNHEDLREAINEYYRTSQFASGALNRTDAESLADYLESGDFPDDELADNIERASREFRQNFRLHSS